MTGDFHLGAETNHLGMLQNDIYSVEDEGTVEESGEALIQNDLGIHFSSDGEEEELPAMTEALNNVMREQATIEKTRMKSSRESAKRRKEKGKNQFETERLIRETAAPLPVVVTKPKTFVSLMRKSDKLDDCRNKMALLKRRLTPEQFELLKRAPRLTVDDSVNTSDNLVVVNAGNARRLGRKEGNAGIPVPRSKPTSIELLNKHLDAKIVTQGNLYQRLQQIRRSKKRERRVDVPKIQPQVEHKFTAPFGYDRAKSLQKEFEEKKRVDEDVDEAELNPLLYPDEEEPLAMRREMDVIEDVEKSCSENESSGEEEEIQSKHVNFRDSVNTPSQKKRPADANGLTSLFIDDEAESGDSDEEAGRERQHAEEYYDEKEYLKDVEDFLTDDECIEEGNMQDIHRKIAMEDDRRAIDALVNKFGVVDTEGAAWMKRLHETNKVHDDTQESVPAERGALGAEHASKVEYLRKLGFTRTRTIQPATNEFMFAEEMRGSDVHHPTSELNDSDLGSFTLEASEESSDEEMDGEIPSESEEMPEDPAVKSWESVPDVQGLGVMELCNRRDAFGMLGRKQKTRPQHVQPSNLIVSSKRVIQ